MNDDENNEELNEFEQKRQEIDERGLSGGNPITNFIKNPVGGFGKLLENGLNRKKKSGGFKEFFRRLPLKVKLIIIGLAVALVLIVIVIIAIGDNTTKKVVKRRSEVVNSFDLSENASVLEKTAIELYNNYDSMLAFTTDQLNKIYEDFKNMDDTDLGYLVTSGQKKFGGEGNDIKSEKALYEHIIRTEKYNFNNINWRKYTHDKDNIEMNTTRIDSLELEVPIKENDDGEKMKEEMPEDDETVVTLMKTTSPYILTNDIPLGMLNGLVSSGNSRSSADQSRAQKFVYQSLKECLARITVNKYILESVKFNTMHEKYDIVKYRQVDRFVGRAIRNEKGEITGMAVDYVGTVSKDILESKPGPEKKEIRESEKKYSYDTYWYVAKAKVYDADIVNNFDYKKYVDEEVEKIINPDVTTFLYADPFERIIDGGKPAAPGSLAEGQTMDVTSEYTAEVGAFNHYEKEWKDKLSPTSTDYNKYDFDDFKEYNTTQDDEFKKLASYSDKKVMSEKEFEAENSVTKNDIKRYEKEDKANNLYGLSIIDFMESNSGIYKQYLTKNSEYGTFIGLGRNKLKEGYKQTKNVLNALLGKEISVEGNTTVSVNFNSATSGVASDKTLPFVYGSSLGYNVTMLYPTNNTTSPIMSGMNLLKEYIRSLEGVGHPITQNSEGVDCYTVYADTAGNLTVGYGINLTGNPADMKSLEELIGETIKEGTLIPVEYVDAIEEEKIQYFYDKVKNETNGLDMKEYQIHALTSMAYNGVSISKIVSNYNNSSYWNEETDDKYEEVYEKYKDNPTATSEIESNADMSKLIYTDGFALYIHDSHGKEQPGLVTRRRSEYILFSLGYYNTLQKFFISGGGSFMGLNVIGANGEPDATLCLQLQQTLEAEIFDNKLKAPASFPLNVIFAKNVPANNSSFLSANYLGYFNDKNYFQCPWYAEGRANIYLNSVNPSKYQGNYLGGGYGHGKSVARGISSQYNIPLGTNIKELRPNSIISYDDGSQYGHVAYVEAVGNEYYVISHCGSGSAWHALSIVKKECPVGDYTGINFVCMDDFIAAGC